MIRNWPGDAAAIELAGRLIDIPSVTGEEAQVVDWLAAELLAYGLPVQRQPVENGRCNLLVAGTRGLEVLFCTHLDTVGPWQRATVKDGVLFGRGACDAKGIAATMVAACLRLRQEGEERVGLLFVVGEETDSIGARKAAETGLKSRFVVVGEPTENQLVSGQKGTLVFRIVARGRSGHSADPTAGPSAIHRLVDSLARIQGQSWDSDPWFGPTTVNIGRIQGGSAVNVVADSAAAEGIFRVAVSTDRILEQVGPCLEEGVEFRFLSRAEPFRLEVIPGFPQRVVAFGSDAPYLAPLGRVLMAGPGSIRFAHRPDEQIALTELTSGIELYLRLSRHLLATA